MASDTDAVSVERVGELWRNWQLRHPAAAKEHNDSFTRRVILGDAKSATGWHIRFAAEAIGVSTAIVSEYVRRHQHD